MQTLKQKLEAYERQQIIQALRANCWHRARTADSLGVTRVTLYNRMKLLGIQSDKDEVNGCPDEKS